MFISWLQPAIGFIAPVPCTPLHLASTSMWICVVNGGYNVEQTIVVEWPQFVGPHAGWWQLHGWFCVNDDDDDRHIMHISIRASPLHGLAAELALPAMLPSKLLAWRTTIPTW